MSKTNRRPSRSGQDRSAASGRYPSGGPGRSSGDVGADPRSSSGPTGSSRAGRRERARPSQLQAPFFERNRSRFVVGGLGAAVILAVGFIFMGATQPAYACTTLTIPAPSASTAPGESPQIGQPQPDMGRQHISPGGTQRYTYCPPASGSHFNIAGQGPIAPRYYGPSDSTVPMGWIHNLEHGALVVLYSCAGGCPDDATLKKLQDFTSPATFPNGPICNTPPGIVGPVITRFDEMTTKYAGLVWDRVLLQDTLDLDAMAAFFTAEGERDNPEQLTCAASPSPSAAASPSPS